MPLNRPHIAAALLLVTSTLIAGCTADDPDPAPLEAHLINNSSTILLATVTANGDADDALEVAPGATVVVQLHVAPEGSVPVEVTWQEPGRVQTTTHSRTPSFDYEGCADRPIILYFTAQGSPGAISTADPEDNCN